MSGSRNLVIRRGPSNLQSPLVLSVKACAPVSLRIRSPDVAVRSSVHVVPAHATLGSGTDSRLSPPPSQDFETIRISKKSIKLGPSKSTAQNMTRHRPILSYCDLQTRRKFRLFSDSVRCIGPVSCSKNLSFNLLSTGNLCIWTRLQFMHSSSRLHPCFLPYQSCGFVRSKAAKMRLTRPKLFKRSSYVCPS